MGYKSVCINCRKSLNREFDSMSDKLYPCSECGKPMIFLPHRFRPPKKTDDKNWETVKFLIENGFYYQHINQKADNKIRATNCTNLAVYPENLRDAKEFVEKYKEQARK